MGKKSPNATNASNAPSLRDWTVYFSFLKISTILAILYVENTQGRSVSDPKKKSEYKRVPRISPYVPTLQSLGRYFSQTAEKIELKPASEERRPKYAKDPGLCVELHPPVQSRSFLRMYDIRTDQNLATYEKLIAKLGKSTGNANYPWGRISSTCLDRPMIRTRVAMEAVSEARDDKRPSHSLLTRLRLDLYLQNIVAGLLT
ncbi:hypothetical protein B0H11DRAFT_1375181 [Mycena galericulata]|nr:hypothetical protein B0H11DRAFT_1375181 [Mycena galericulata]